MATIVGFSDNSYPNNTTTNFSPGSYIDCPAEILNGPEISAIQLLSNCLEFMFDSPESFYSDAKLVIADGREISFHRCLLSARNSVFKTALASTAAAEKRFSAAATVKLELKEIAKDYEVGFDSVVTVLAYLYSGRVRLLRVDCMVKDCCHVACRPTVDFMVEVLYLAFVFQIPELMTLYERHFLDIVDKVVVEDIFVIFKLADICGKAYKKLLDRCIEIVVKSNIENVSLEKSLPQHIVKQIIDLRKVFGLELPEPDKHAMNIYKALDSDDLELVKMLLTEGHTNLDDAYALHFAIAHCDLKTAKDLLDLELADVNHRNQRGYTVLHVAAMRMEPKLIVSLLIKGANVSETTFDGRTALMIVRRLTKAVDYNTTIEPGKHSPKGVICIEALEQANKVEPFPREFSLHFLPMTPDELKMRLLYLENRVALARLLFPAEAEVIFDIIQSDGTREFTASSLEHDHAEKTLLDLNTTPFRIQEEHLRRLKVLSRTVELGNRYFPRYSLNHFMDIEDFAHLRCIEEEDTPEKRLKKKQRYMELQETLMKTFSEDKEELGKTSKSKPSDVMRSRRLRLDKRKF